MGADLTQTGATLVYGLINTANPNMVNGAASAANVTLGTPTTTGASPNTSLGLTAVAGEGYSGDDTVTYNRIDIGAMFTTWGVTPTLGGNYTNASDMLADLNAAYDLNLQAGDIVDGPINATSYPFVYTLTINADSLTYINALNVTLNQPS